MPNITLSLSKDVHDKMKRHPEIRWSRLVSQTISERVDTLEMTDKLLAKSKLTKNDVDEIAKKINKDIFRELNKRFLAAKK